MKRSSRKPRRDRPSRHRGGQPGNTNALKHGYYAHLYRRRELRLLEEQPLIDLSAEIELLHVTTARFLEALAASNRTTDYDSSVTALRLVTLSAQTIASLVRAQAFTTAANDDPFAIDLPPDDDELPAEEAPPA